MMSLVAKRFDDAKAGKPIRLFKSHRDGIADGEQKRDFIYVDDAVAVVRWMLETPAGDGHFQRRHRQGAQLQGSDHRDVSRRSGASRTSNTSTCRAEIRDQYQYFTQAEVANLQRAGYNAGFAPLEDACAATSPNSSIAKTGIAGCSISKNVSQNIAQQTILCVGDLMLDDFVYGEVGRISPEAPAPVLAVKRNEIAIGGAGNVARNIASLGARCIFVGLVGEDDAGREVIARLQADPLIEPSLVVDRTRPTTRKMRFVSEHFSTHLLRADWEMAGPVDADREGELIARALAALPRVGAVVLSDYAKGVLTPRVDRAR